MPLIKLTLTACLAMAIGIGAALADDDDGGDDDGGASFSDSPRSSNSRNSSFGQRVVRRAQSFVPPLRARSQIVAVGLSTESVNRLTEQGYRVLRQQDLINGNSITLLRTRRGISIEQARAEVVAETDGDLADFNYYYRPQLWPGCEKQGCESLALIDWQAVEPNRCGRAPVIGIVDTGMNLKHEALVSSDIETITLRDPSLAPSGKQHGTAVAALLSGGYGSRLPGLLPSAKLIAVDPYHRGARADDRTDIYDLVRAIDLLVARRPDAINLSLSGPESPLLKMAVDDAYKRNVPVIAAAGNNGPKAKPAFPAAYEGVIAVTAVDSKYKIFRRAVKGGHIDFAAPGVGIWTAAPQRGLRRASGTSYAAPFVTAAVALGKVREPAITPNAIETLLAGQTLDLGVKGRDEAYGWGLIRATKLCEASAGASR